MTQEEIVARALGIFCASQYAESDLGSGVEREIITLDTRRPTVMGGALEVINWLVSLDGWRGYTEAGFIAAAVHDDTNVTVTTDSGRAQIEVVYPVCGRVQRFHEIASTIMQMVAHSAKEQEFALLGLGRHPVARGTQRDWIPKSRYKKVRASLRPEGADLTLETASIQVTTDARSKEHAIAMVNVGNYLSPLVVALAANSSVFHGRVHLRELASRRQVWSWICRSEDLGRVGIPPWFRDFEHYLEVLLDQRYMFHVYPDQDKTADCFGQSVAEAVRRYGEDDEAFSHLLRVHIGSVWWEARIRLNGCISVEFRTPCGQQTVAGDTAIAALYLGLAEKTDDAADLVASIGTEAWVKALPHAAGLGFGAEVGKYNICAPIRDMLVIAREGLRDRGRDEERYLDPLCERVKRRVTLAEDAAGAFHEGGLNKLLARASI